MFTQDQQQLWYKQHLENLQKLKQEKAKQNPNHADLPNSHAAQPPLPSEPPKGAPPPPPPKEEEPAPPPPPEVSFPTMLARAARCPHSLAGNTLILRPRQRRAPILPRICVEAGQKARPGGGGPTPAAPGCGGSVAAGSAAKGQLALSGSDAAA